jgi:hypothetical protein
MSWYGREALENAERDAQVAERDVQMAKKSGQREALTGIPCDGRQHELVPPGQIYNVIDEAKQDHEADGQERRVVLRKLFKSQDQFIRVVSLNFRESRCTKNRKKRNLILSLTITAVLA